MSTVQFAGKSYTVRGGETILDALIRGGANVSYSCRRGNCHTCMLQVVGADAGSNIAPDFARHLARDRLPKALRDAGVFLPCLTLCDENLVVQRADLTRIFRLCMVAEKTQLANGLLRLRLEPPGIIFWHPGQFVSIKNPAGLSHSYALTSLATVDYVMELHIERAPNGRVSTWLHEMVEAGDWLELQGPSGECHYKSTMQTQSLLLIATGIGGGALLGVARDALSRGHNGPIWLYHGVEEAADLYLTQEFAQLQANHPTVTAVSCVAGPGEVPPHVRRGRASELAFADQPTLDGAVVFLFGSANMVSDAHAVALNRGVAAGDVYASVHSSETTTALPGSVP